MSDTSKTFDKVLTAFRNRLDPHELEMFRLTTLEEWQTEIQKIQSRQETQKNMIGLSRIQAYAEALEQLGKVVEVFLNVSDAIAFIWGPMKFMLHTAASWTNAFDKLLEGYQTLGENFPLLLQYESLFGKDEKMKRCLELLYCDILEFHRRALPFFTRKLWRQVFRAMWNDFGSRFNDIISSIQRHTKMLESQAHLIHFENDVVTRNLLYDLENQQRSTIQHLKQAEEDRKRDSIIAVKQWIGASSVDYVHEEACSYWKQYTGTGEWILRDKHVDSWKDDEFPADCILWLHGIPGAGKTVLTSVIVESCKGISGAQVIYFYCRYDDEQTNRSLAILKNLLAQLVTIHEGLTPYFLEKCRESREPVLSDEKRARDLVELACHEKDRHYIILDGLDECSSADRRAILTFCTSLVKTIESKEPGKLRILIVSQTEDDIAKAMSNSDSLELVQDHVAPDISKYVAVEVEKIQQKFPLSDEQCEFINQQVNNLSSGQFIYAKLVLDNLYNQKDLKQLRYELETPQFPIELEQAYERIWARIGFRTSNSQWEHVEKILGWMICAARPMKWHEIQAALAVDVENGFLNFRDLSARQHIKDFCGSLVRVYDNDRVTLVHSTARTFMIKTGRISADRVEYDLATLCLRYLTFDCFGDTNNQEETLKHVLTGQYAFQDYAIAKWVQHFQKAVHLPLKSDQDVQDEGYVTQDLSEAVDEFYATFQKEFCMETQSNGQANESEPEASDLFRHFQDPNTQAEIHQILEHIKAFDRSSPTAYNEISIASLRSSLESSRKYIEQFYKSQNSPSTNDPEFASFYGTSLYKCPKLTCYNFHEGFVNGKIKQSHIDRHERPYRCPIPDCSATEFGFTTKSNLQTHLRNSHPEAVDQSSSFPSQRNPVLETSKHRCPQCPKIFARKAILNDHLLNHAGKKPWECSKCGKAFTRKNDRNRHEQHRHNLKARSGGLNR